MKLVSSPNMTKQYFVAINLLGEWGSMQMTVMSEGPKFKNKMGHEEEGFEAFFTQPPLVIVCHEFNHLTVIHLWLGDGLKCR